MCVKQQVDAIKVADCLRCCIAGDCDKCGYQKYFACCGDRLHQDCLMLIETAYKKENGQMCDEPFYRPGEDAWTEGLVDMVNHHAETAPTEEVAAPEEETEPAEEAPKPAEEEKPASEEAPAAPAPMKVSYKQACESHRIRRVDAFVRAVLCGLLASGIYMGCVAGWIPDAAAAVMAAVLTGYTIWMAAIMVQEIRWYRKNEIGKKVKA